MDGLKSTVFAHSTLPILENTKIDNRMVQFTHKEVYKVKDYKTSNKILYQSRVTDCRELMLNDVVEMLNNFEPLYYYYARKTIKLHLPYGVKEYTRPYLDVIYKQLNYHHNFVWNYTNHSTEFKMLHGNFSVPFGSCIMYFVLYTYSTFRQLEYEGKLKENPTHHDIYPILGLLTRRDPYDGPFTIYPVWYSFKYGADFQFTPYDNCYGNSTTGISTYVQRLLKEGSHIKRFNEFLKEYNIPTKPMGTWLNYILNIIKTDSNTHNVTVPVMDGDHYE